MSDESKPFAPSEDEAPDVHPGFEVGSKGDTERVEPTEGPTPAADTEEGYSELFVHLAKGTKPSLQNRALRYESNDLRFWREDPRAVLPSRSHETDSGLDLSSIETLTLRPGMIRTVDTGLRIALPVGCEGQVRPRSGLAAKHGITVLNAPGTIDEGFRGRMKVILVNHGAANFLVEEGMRIAQLIIMPITRFDPVEVSERDGLGYTDRGSDGFGSTGL